VNIRSLTRGDGAVIGAAVLLLIASFLPFYSNPGGSANTWHSEFFPLLPSVTFTAIAAAVAVLLARSGQFATRQLLGLSLEQWAIALSLFSGWSAVWSTLFRGDYLGADRGIGNWLTLLFGLCIAVAAPLSNKLPQLKAPLLSAPRPAAQPYGVGAGQPGLGQPYGANPPQAGYGYPGGAQSVDPSYGQAQQQAAPPYGGAPQPTAQAAQAAPAPAGDFTAFWFAVPVPRPLFAEDGTGSQIAELTPGTWYLAVDQHGPSLIAQTQDGRRGVLQDSSGIQRG
jgi:hypothetical protein